MQWIEQFKTMYQQLNATNLHSLDDFYSQQAEFVDPFHRVEGLAAIRNYFANLYSNVESIEFTYNWQVIELPQVAIGWTMTFTHPKINRGQPVQIQGASRLQLVDNKIVQHQDYFDGGAMLYEHIPVLGSAVRYVKQRMAAA